MHLNLPSIHTAIARPDKLGTDPRAVGGINTLTPPRKAGGIPWVVSKHKIQPGCGEWAGWRGARQPSMSRETKFSGASGDREIADREKDWQQPYPVDPFSATSNAHTCIQPLMENLWAGRDSHGSGGAVLWVWWAGSKWAHVRRV